MNKVSIFLVALLFNPLLGFSQNPSNSDQHNDMEHKQISITGCLTKNSHKEFELVDEKGMHSLPYSASVNLNQYVGQTVTLVGRLGATPSADTGGSRKPHFMVSQVQSESGQCKK